ncbi:MAG TPA: DUF4231 domain-containing protein [Puia sp.]|nr:DUF4231 domain-containing protein [Puia sp.]
MSETTDQLAYLKERITGSITNVNSNRVYYRKMAYRFYISTVILSALTTIILGLNIEELKEAVRIIALIITTTVTVLNAYIGYFNYKELWIAYNKALNQFAQLQFEIEFMEKGGTALTLDQILVLRGRCQQIYDELNATWQKNRAPEKK